MNSWYGYVHQNGSLHVKRFFGPDDIAEANESPFVLAVFGPWSCEGRDQAIEFLKRDVNMIRK